MKNQHTVTYNYHQQTSRPIYTETKTSIKLYTLDKYLSILFRFLKNYSFKYLIDFVKSHKKFLYQIHVNSKFVILLE